MTGGPARGPSSSSSSTGSASAPTRPGDAIAAAPMPRWRGAARALARTRCSRASEDAVGLPAGQMGNSEVGHLNLGAGRPVLQDLPRIDAAIADGSFFDRGRRSSRPASGRSETGPAARRRPRSARAASTPTTATSSRSSSSPRGWACPSVRVHALLDGRDTPPRSALGFVRDLEARLAAVHPDARIATVGGRYWAMDRDQRWDRIERGYDAIVHGVGEHAPSATAAIEAGYARGETDEFVAPTVIDGVDGALRDRDPIVHVNFRADRARQLTHALARPGVRRLRPASPDGRPAPRGPARRDDDRVRGRAAGRGRVRARGGALARRRRSARPAGRSSTSPRPRSTPTSRTSSTAASRPPWPGEERRLVPEPAGRDVRPPARDERRRRHRRARRRDRARRRYDFIVANFANPDMVGHTGVWDATVAALEALDACLGRIVDAVAGVEARRSRTGRARVLFDHRRPRQRRRHASTRDGNPVTAALAQPGARCSASGRAARRPDARATASSPTSRRRSSSSPGLPAWDGMTGRSLLDADALAAGRPPTASATIRSPSHLGGPAHP